MHNTKTNRGWELRHIQDARKREQHEKIRGNSAFPQWKREPMAVPDATAVNNRHPHSSSHKNWDGPGFFRRLWHGVREEFHFGDVDDGKQTGSAAERHPNVEPAQLSINHHHPDAALGRLYKLLNELEGVRRGVSMLEPMIGKGGEQNLFDVGVAHAVLGALGRYSKSEEILEEAGKAVVELREGNALPLSGLLERISAAEKEEAEFVLQAKERAGQFRESLSNSLAEDGIRQKALVDALAAVEASNGHDLVKNLQFAIAESRDAGMQDIEGELRHDLHRLMVLEAGDAGAVRNFGAEGVAREDGMRGFVEVLMHLPEEALLKSVQDSAKAAVNARDAIHKLEASLRADA